MIFGPRLREAIHNGSKTMTRRPVKPYKRPRDPDWITNPKTGVKRRRPKPKLVEINGRMYVRCYYQVGHSYPVKSSRASSPAGRITVTAVRHERLGAITREDARREGFARRGIGSVDMFKDYWCDLYGETDPVTGEKVPVEFDEHLLVWVIEFTRGDDDSIYMATPIAGKQGDYTTNIEQAIDELPVIGGRVLDDFAKKNNDNFKKQRKDEFERRDVRASVERIKRLSKRPGAAEVVGQLVDEAERRLLKGKPVVPELKDPSKGYTLCNSCNSRGVITLLDPDDHRQGPTGPACEDCAAEFEQAA